MLEVNKEAYTEAVAPLGMCFGSVALNDFLACSAFMSSNPFFLLFLFLFLFVLSSSASSFSSLPSLFFFFFFVFFFSFFSFFIKFSFSNCSFIASKTSPVGLIGMKDGASFKLTPSFISSQLSFASRMAFSETTTPLGRNTTNFVLPLKSNPVRGHENTPFSMVGRNLLLLLLLLLLLFVFSESSSFL